MLQQKREEIDLANLELNDVIHDMDKKLTKVIKRHEADYLKGYSIYVREKERELRELVMKLNDRNNDSTLKDEIIFGLKNQISKQQDFAIVQEQEIDQLKLKVTTVQATCDEFNKDKDFLNKQIMESKRQNKLLKLAIVRLQDELSMTKENLKQKEEAEQHENKVFVTAVREGTLRTQFPSTKSNDNFAPILIENQRLNPATPLNQISIGLGAASKFTTQENTMIEDSFQKSKLMSEQNSQQFFNSSSQSPEYKKRQTNSHLETINLKFQRFVELLFKSKLPLQEVKSQILSYVRTLETNYNDVISNLKDQLAKQNLKQKKLIGENAISIANREDLETLFKECVEQVRRQIMKNRLKTQIQTKGNQKILQTEESREFEESLMKIDLFQKNKINYAGFTNRDKYHILDLFVNNEKTLNKIYDILFPDRQLAKFNSELHMQISEGKQTNSISREGNHTMYKSVTNLNANQPYGNSHTNLSDIAVSINPQQYGSQFVKNNSRYLQQLNSFAYSGGKSYNLNVAQVTTKSVKLFEKLDRMNSQSLPKL